jgi:hypothetical protein
MQNLFAIHLGHMVVLSQPKVFGINLVPMEAHLAHIVLGILSLQMALQLLALIC